MMASVLLTAHVSENEEPYVTPTFGVGVSAQDRDELLSLLCGHGLSCGWGPGRISEARAAAHRVGRQLRRLGWSVSVDTD